MLKPPFYKFFKISFALNLFLAFIFINLLTSQSLKAQTIERTIVLTEFNAKAVETFKTKNILYYPSNVSNPESSSIPLVTGGFELPLGKNVEIRDFKTFYSKSNITIAYSGAGIRNPDPVVTVNKGRREQSVTVTFLPGQ